jgi:hypothetical protein
VTHCVKSKEINLSPPNWLLRLTHKERLSALEFVPRYVYFPACPVSMRTIRDCNASALIPARKSSIAVLSPRLHCSGIAFMLRSCWGRLIAGLAKRAVRLPDQAQSVRPGRHARGLPASSRMPTIGQRLPFGRPSGRILWNSDAGRARRRLRQDRASSVCCADRTCNAYAITWRPCVTAVLLSIRPSPPG